MKKIDDQVNRLDEKLRLMMGYYISLIEGDTHMVEDAYKLMYEYGVTDEDGFEL